MNDSCECFPFVTFFIFYKRWDSASGQDSGSGGSGEEEKNIK